MIIAITTVAAAYQDSISIYKDAIYAQPANSFGDGDTVYLTVTDNNINGGSKIISVTNDQLANLIYVTVSDSDLDTIYEGSFIIHSGVDEAGKLHMENGQTATIEADLDGNVDGATKQIIANYGLIDMLWIYSDSSRTEEATKFGDGDTIYLKITDTETKGDTKTLTVKNDQIRNTISINVTDSNRDSFYLGSFVIYSGVNDDANDKLALFDGQTATITADLAGDGVFSAKQITADYGIAPTASIIYDPSSVTENTDVAVILGTSEDVTQVPTSLIITFSDGSSSDITLAGIVPGSTFTGYFTVTDEVPDGQATFSLAEGALVDEDGDSGNTITSGETILIDRSSPPAPYTLTAIATDSTIKLTWTVPTETDLDQYNIYRGTYSGGENFNTPVGIIIASGQNSYEWIDYNIILGMTYYYVVRAEDIASNESGNSSEASAAVTTQLLSLGFQKPFVVRSGPAKVIIRVSESTNVSIRIFNLNSLIVYEWNSYFSSSEEKEWAWNGVNMYGEEVNNGVYIWRIEAGDEEITKIVGVLR